MKRLLILLCLLFVSSPLFSQYYFGRNKVQYDNFEWHVLKTEHFDIYYYPEMSELAEIGAAYAEEAYHRLTNKFDHDINRRVPLIFYSNHLHFQQTNTTPGLIPQGVGGFFEFLKGRVVIPANGSIHDFKHVINHELVHVFMHAKVTRVLKDHRRTNFPGPPLWFIEGLAEYWGEGWDTEAEMFLRDATISGYLVPLHEMYRIYGSFLMYKEGQAICKFIAERFGEEKLLQLMENIWMSDNFSEVMRLTLGVDYRRFDELWFYHEMKQKYPILKDNDLPGMVTERLTKKGINTKPAYCKADGKESIVFISNRVGYSNIYEMPYDDPQPEQELRVLVQGERTTEFEAFNLLSSKMDANERGELVVVAKSKGKDAIYKIDIGTGDVLQRLQFDGEGLVTLFSPNWHPSNEKIVFTGIDFAGRSDLYTFDFQSEALEKLTNDFFDDRDPAWSPDGNYIVFSSDRTPYGKNGTYNLFIHEIANGNISYLTYGEHNDLTPAWSPDGRALVFTSDRDGGYNIWMMRLPPERPQYVASLGGADLADKLPPYPSALDQRSELKKLTNFITGAFDPVWTADDALLFTAFEGFSFQLRRMRNISQMFEERVAATPDSLFGSPEIWSMPRLQGNTSASSYSYKKKFSLDIAQSQIVQDPIYGTAGGAQFAMSDMLGNHQYYFLIYNTASTRDELLKSFNIALTKVDLSRRANTAFGAYHFAGNYYNSANGFYYERRYGGFAAVSYPISVFQRLEASLNVRKSERELFGPESGREAVLVSNFVSFTKDNSLWGPSGPIDGERYSFSIGNTLDVSQVNTNFFTLMADYRRYFRLNTRMSYAVRLWTAMNHGKGADFYRFFMGGSWDLRLYPRWQIWGQKLFLVSQELRFPFVDRFSLAFPFGGIGFSSIRGALFADIGNAWDDRLEDLLGAVGFSARMRLGGLLVLRYDVGRRFQINDIDSGLNSVRFSPQWVHKFFFGWDF